jgi:omega-amidase
MHILTTNFLIVTQFLYLGDDVTTGYKAWGHSSISDPWGAIVATTGHEVDVVVADIDVSQVATMRAQIPCLQQKRHDVYSKYKK